MLVTGETSVEQIDQSSDETLLVLEPLQSQIQNQRLLLKPGRYTIGSADGCSLKLSAPGVGPKHCLIIAGNHRTILKALDHRTWIDDGPVQESLLQPGDRLTIGPMEFEIRRIPFHSKGSQDDHQSANDITEDGRAGDDLQGDMSQPVQTERSENPTSAADATRLFERKASPHQPAVTVKPPGFECVDSPGDRSIEHEATRPDPRAPEEFDTGLDRRIEQRMDELVRQQQMLAETLEQHHPAFSHMAFRQLRDPGIDARIASTQRQKTQPGELPAGVQQSSETLWRDQREITTKQRFRDHVSRFENDLAIERALVRVDQKDIARRESEIQSFETKIAERMEELRANETSHAEDVEARRLQGDSRQAELERTSVELESRKIDLDARESAIDRRLGEMDQRSAELLEQERQLDALKESRVSNEVQSESQEAVVQQHFQEQEILLRRREAELSDQFSEVEAARIVVEAQQEELQQSRKALAEERRDRMEQLDQAERDVHCKQKRLESEEKKQREDRQKHFDEQQAKIKSDRDELVAQRRLLEQSQGELTAGREEIESARVKIEQRQQQLEQDLAAFQRTRDEFSASRESTVSESEKQNERQVRFEEKERELEEKKSGLQVEIEQLDAGRRQLDADREVFERQRDALKKDHDALVTQLAERDETQQRLDEQRKQLDLDLAKHEADRRQLQSDREDLDRQHEELKQDLDLTPEWQIELEDARKELDDERLNLRIKQEQIESDRLQLADDRKEIESLRTEDHQLAEDREALAHQREVLSNDRQALQNKEADLEEFRRQLNEERELFQTQRDALEIEKAELALEREQAVAQNEGIRETRSPLVQEREECESSENKNQPSNSGEPESVAAYMERLLGRSPGESSLETSEHGAQAAVPEAVDLKSTETAVGQSESSQLEADEPGAVSPASDKPICRQDKAAIRADLDLLRRVANRSARSAIAKHTWRKLRGRIVIKAVLTVIAIITAVVLFTSELWGTTSYASFGWLAGAVGAISALELLRTTWSVSRRIGAARGTRVENFREGIRDDEKAGTIAEVDDHEEDPALSYEDPALSYEEDGDSVPGELPDPAMIESPVSDGPQRTEVETSPATAKAKEDVPLDVPLDGLFGASELIVAESGISIRSETTSDHHQTPDGDSTGDALDAGAIADQRRESQPDPIAEAFGMLDSLLDDVGKSPETDQPEASNSRLPWEESDEIDS